MRNSDILILFPPPQLSSVVINVLTKGDVVEKCVRGWFPDQGQQRLLVGLNPDFEWVTSRRKVVYATSQRMSDV